MFFIIKTVFSLKGVQLKRFIYVSPTTKINICVQMLIFLIYLLSPLYLI